MKTALLALLLFFGPADDPEQLSEKALELASANQLDQAAALWKQALAIDPAHFPSLFNLGFMSFQQGNLEAAVSYLEKAAKANPGDFNTRYLAGVAFVDHLAGPEFKTGDSGFNARYLFLLCLVHLLLA